MGMVLAFKRVGRLYRTRLLRLAKGFFIYAVGFWAGIESGIHFNFSPSFLASVSEWILGASLAFVILAWMIQLIIDAPLPAGQDKAV